MKTLTLMLALFLGLGSFATAQPVLTLPPRPDGAITGAAFKDEILNLPRRAREQRIFEEIESGNIPDFLRTLVPVTVTHGGHTATFHVAPDYLGVGTDDDFFRLPMSAPLAQQVADTARAVLPTRRMVDAIHAANGIQVAPRPFHPDDYQIDTVAVFWLSHQAIEDQIAGQPRGPIVSGIKKDIVVTPQIGQRPPPPRIAIYGWHRLNNQPIQPLSLVHVDYYADYSHGLRLVAETLTVNGEQTTVTQVLADPELAPLLSDEDSFTPARYPITQPFDTRRPNGWMLTETPPGKQE